MNNKQLLHLLRRKKACKEAIAWIESRDAATAWAECPRGDWMLWICAHMVGKRGWPTHQEVVLAACDCAATALRFVPASESKPRLAIKTAIRWANGKATLDDVSLVTGIYHDAAAAYTISAAEAAAHAASCAAYAASSAAYAAHVDEAAASASYAAAAASFAAASAAARNKSLLRSARICRRLLRIGAALEVK